LAEVIPDWPELKPFAKKKQVQLLETMTQQPFTRNQSIRRGEPCGYTRWRFNAPSSLLKKNI
jgi:hypothetical protein